MDFEMQKWEYLFVEADKEPSGLLTPEGDWKIRVVNSIERKDWKEGETVEVFCNRMGQLGWEIVGVTHYPPMRTIMSRFQIVLKRGVSEG